MSKPAVESIPPQLPDGESDADELAQYRVALGQAKSIKGAARLLGVSPATVRARVDEWPTLKAYLPNASPPSEAELIACPAHVPLKPSTPGTEEEMLAAMERADAQVRTGLAAMGIGAEAIEEAVAMAAFARVSFESMGAMVNGGLASLFIELRSEVKKITKRIETTCEDGQPIDFEEEQMLRNDRSAMVKHLIDISAGIREATLTSARVAQIRSEIANGDDKKGARGKPRLGATPLQAVQIRTTGPTEMRMVSHSEH